MSDLQNPVFDSEREFLERQKLEYKNALLNDVEDIKEQTTQIGKGALLLGGAVAGVWIISKMISGKKRKKKKKKNGTKLLQDHLAPYSGAYPVPVSHAFRQPDDEVNFGSPLDFNQPVTDDESISDFYNAQPQHFAPNQQLVPSHYAIHQHYHAAKENGSHKSFLESDFVKSLATQAMAFLLVYLSKKAEEFLLKNVDIATEKGVKTHDVDFTDLNSDAGRNL
jgi:hypothetical protein